MALTNKGSSIPIINEYVERLADAILALITCFSLANALIFTLSFNYSPIIVLYIISIFMFLFIVIFINKKTTLIFTGSLLIFMIAWFIYLVYKGNVIRIIDKFNTVLVWFTDYMNGYEKLNRDYAFLSTLFICFIVTILVYIFTVKYFNFYIILFGGILIFVTQIMMNYSISYLSFHLFIVLTLIYYFKHVYIKNSTSEENNYAKKNIFAIFSLPLILVIFIVSFYLPKSNKPIEWEWLDDKIIAWFDFYNEKFRFVSYDYFSFSSTGFGKDDGRLGGKVNLDDTPVMEVETSDSIYLRGAIRDVYTGISWANSQNFFTEYDVDDSKYILISDNKNENKYDNDNRNDNGNGNDNGNNNYNDNNDIRYEYQYDIIEPLIGFTLFKDSYDLNDGMTNEEIINNESVNNFSNNITVNTIDNIIKKSNLKIRYLNLKTKTIFTPTKTLRFNPLKRYTGNTFFDAEGIFSSQNKLSKGFEYELEIYNINYNDEIFKKLVRKSYSGLYHYILNENSGLYEDNEDIDVQSLYRNGVKFDNKNISISIDDIKKLADISVDISNKYLQLPETVPKRIEQIALSITKDFDNNYDKVKAIEVYLASKYPYTLKPDPTPNGRDFADYFLFDLKEGYCVYYATAMVVMLRSIGIPARYVEGYMLPPEAVTTGYSSNAGESTNNLESSKKVFKVTNKNAHAWVEVYFEGFGWIPFEPTAPFIFGFYMNNNYRGSISSSFIEDPYYHEYLRMLEEYDYMGAGNIQLSKRLPEDEFEPPPYNFKGIIILFAAVILILLTFTSILNIIRRKAYIFRIVKTEPKKSVINMFGYYFRIFSSIGLNIQNYETPTEYIKRIEQQFAYDKYKYDNETFENFMKRVDNPEFLSKHSGLMDAVEVYQLARYSKQEIDEKQKNIVLEYYPKIIAEAKGNLGIVKYYIYRYILGRF